MPYKRGATVKQTLFPAARKISNILPNVSPMRNTKPVIRNKLQRWHKNTNNTIN
jgi:hypothetical protein